MRFFFLLLMMGCGADDSAETKEEFRQEIMDNLKDNLGDRCVLNKVEQTLVWEEDRIVQVCYQSTIAGCPLPESIGDAND